jgi:aminopeptidase YwaD
MRIKIIFFLFFLPTAALDGFSQTNATKALFEQLCSRKFWGRGYTKNGMPKAANYLEQKFADLGLQPLFAHNKFQQYFTLSTNSFPGRMKIQLNGRSLKAGVDFIVKPSSTGLKGSFYLQQEKEQVFASKNGDLQVLTGQKMWWTPSKQADTKTTILLKDSLENTAYNLKVNVKQKWESSYQVSNIGAWIKGTAYPDSFIFFTAHYDHLGGMGNKVYFPGANDNASGTALLYELAQYYAKYPSKYSIVFVAFAAEEIGLEGSKYFVANPAVDLNRIKLVVNLDLMGNGDDGLTVVNAVQEQETYGQLVAANEQQNLFKVINARDNAANSDHYPFTQKGVPAIFIYSLGNHNAYHDVYDRFHPKLLQYFPNYIKLLDVLVSR